MAAVISTSTSSPGCDPFEVDRLAVPGAPAQLRLVGPARPFDQHLEVAPDEPLRPLPGPPLHDLQEPLHPLRLDRMRHLPVHRRRLGFPTRREDEGEGAVVADLLGDFQGLGEVGLGLAGEADDDVGGDRAVGDVLADQRDPVHVALTVVGAAHPLEDRAGARLQRQVDLLAERRQLGVGADHVLLHVLGVRAGVADPLDALDRVDPGQQLGEADPAVLRQLAAVAVDVLPQQRHLAHAVGGERPPRRSARRGRG